MSDKEGKQEKLLKAGGVELPAWVTDAREGICLEMTHPEAQGALKIIPIDKAKSYLVGRHEGEFNVVVDHVTVSRRHALLVHKGDAVFLYDMSSNGSSINGAPSAKKEYCELQVGDQIRFGDHPSTFTIALQKLTSTALRPAAALASAATVGKQGAPAPTARRKSGEAALPIANASPTTSTGRTPRGNLLIIHGLKLHIGSKGLEVRTVEPDSVAESHPFPFSWGDLVESIDDADTSTMSKEAISEALEHGRNIDQIRLAIKKGGEVRHVTLGGVGKAQAKAQDPAHTSSSWKVRLADMLQEAGASKLRTQGDTARDSSLESASGNIAGENDPELLPQKTLIPAHQPSPTRAGESGSVSKPPPRPNRTPKLEIDGATSTAPSAVAHGWKVTNAQQCSFKNSQVQATHTLSVCPLSRARARARTRALSHAITHSLTLIRMRARALSLSRTCTQTCRWLRQVVVEARAHTHTNTHTHTHSNARTHTYTYTYTHMHTHTRTNTPTRTHAQRERGTHTYTHIHTPNARTHTYTYTHTHMHTHTRTHTPTRTHAQRERGTHTYAHIHTHTGGDGGWWWRR